MYEKRWKLVPPQLLTSSGTALGSLTVANACLFRVKQQILLRAVTQPNLLLEVKRIEEDGVTIYLGPPNTGIHLRTDISAYTTLLLSSIEANEQSRSLIPEEQIERLTYQEEPTVARRSFLVDCLGRPYNRTNPFPVEIDASTVNVQVQLTAKDNDPNLGDIHDSVRIGDGTEELLINPDGSINVVSSVGGAVNPHVLNTPVLLAGTEYFATLPKETKRFIFRMRNASRCQMAYVSGETATNYITMNCGVVYQEGGLTLSAPLTLYFNSAKPSEVAEIIFWT